MLPLQMQPKKLCGCAHSSLSWISHLQQPQSFSLTTRAVLLLPTTLSLIHVLNTLIYVIILSGSASNNMKLNSNMCLPKTCWLMFSPKLCLEKHSKNSVLSWEYYQWMDDSMSRSNGVYSVKVHIVFSSSAPTVHLHLTAPL